MSKEIKTIQNWIRFFILSLFISGITAIPVEGELTYIVAQFPFEGTIKGFLEQILIGIKQTSKDFPFLFYGYDWLAFAHIVLAILFIGPLRDPVKNKWVIQFGIIACILIIPFALIMGGVRGMPFWWRLIDCSFGVIGSIPLIICLKNIKKLETAENTEAEKKEAFDLLLQDSKMELSNH